MGGEAEDSTSSITSGRAGNQSGEGGEVGSNIRGVAEVEDSTKSKTSGRVCKHSGEGGGVEIQHLEGGARRYKIAPCPNFGTCLQAF